MNAYEAVCRPAAALTERHIIMTRSLSISSKNTPCNAKGDSTDDTQSCPAGAYDLERVELLFRGVKRRHTSIVGRYLLKNTPTSVAKTATAINTRSSTVQRYQRLRAPPSLIFEYRQVCQAVGTHSG